MYADEYSRGCPTEISTGIETFWQSLILEHFFRRNVNSFLMTKATTPFWLESDPAALRGRPVTNIPVARSVKAIPAHPILVARNMTLPYFSWVARDDVPFIRAQSVGGFSFMKTTALFETQPHSLTCCS